MSLLDGRRRQILGKGQSMVLRRPLATALPITYQTVTLTGFLRAYRPETLTGGIQQGDSQCSILNDEIAAAAWPVPPVKGDSLVASGRTWILKGAWTVLEAQATIGWELWLAGGMA